MNIPKVTDDHVGLLAPQSKHTLRTETVLIVSTPPPLIISTSNYSCTLFAVCDLKRANTAAMSSGSGFDIIYSISIIYLSNCCHSCHTHQLSATHTSSTTLFTLARPRLPTRRLVRVVAALCDLFIHFFHSLSTISVI